MTYKTRTNKNLLNKFVAAFLPPILILENIATSRIKAFCDGFVIYFDLLMEILISNYFKNSSSNQEIH